MARNPQVDWAALTDVLLGCTNQAGEDNRNVARMAALPQEVPGSTINRLCGSSLDAVGTVTAGNASGVNDGACALLLANEAAATRHGPTPRARIVGMAAAGVPPRIMGFGPAPATRKVLELTGLSLAQMDVIAQWCKAQVYTGKNRKISLSVPTC